MSKPNPLRLAPAVYACHRPTLRRMFGVSAVDDRVYLYWRLPMFLGAAIAHTMRQIHWDDAYAEAAQRRNWQACERLLDQRPPHSEIVRLAAKGMRITFTRGAES